MAFRVRITEGFEADLFDTLTYLSENLSAPMAAQRFMQGVDAAEALLVCQPFIHALSRKPHLRGSGCREHPVESYVVVYRVEGDEVVFLRLFHQRQLYDRAVP